MNYTITVDDSHYFDTKLVMVCRNDRVIELYTVDRNGLEEYAGRLDHNLTTDRDPARLEQVRQLLHHVKDRIMERPLSRESLAWLQGVSSGGMLARWEDPQVRR